MGGVATITDNYKTYAQQAYVAIMGPIWGLSLAALTMVIGIVTHNSFFTITASWMALFNLFNLIPVTFLDGGQTLKTIVLSLSKKNGFLIINIVTIIAASIFILYIPSLLVILAAIFSIIQNNTEKKMILADKNYHQPKDLTKKQIVFTIGSYFLTAILLVFVFSFSLTVTHALTGHYTFWIK
jgi:Zn-dependent protease